MKKIFTLFLMAGIFATSLVNAQQKQIKYEGDDWKTADDYKKAEPKILEYIHWLEDNPLAPEQQRQAKSQTVLRWLTQVPYRGVVEINGRFIENVQDSKYKYPNGLSSVYMYGKASYYLETHTDNDVKSSVYGVNALIKYYKNILKVDKTATNTVMEKYIKLQAENKLEEFVKEEMKKSPY